MKKNKSIKKRNFVVFGSLVSGVIPLILGFMFGFKKTVMLSFVLLIVVVSVAFTKKGKKFIFERYVNFVIIDELIKNDIFYGESSDFVYTLKVKSKQKNDDSLIVKIENSSEYQTKILDIDFSSALKNWIFESSSISDDGNFIVLKLVKNPEKRQLRLKSISDLKKINAPNFLILDKNVLVKKGEHMLITGKTGSGKTISLIYILMSYFFDGWDLRICDKKSSDIAILSQRIATQSAVTETDILSLLRKVIDDMNCRKKELMKNQEIGKTAIEKGYRGVLLVIDEYLSLVSASTNKKTRDEITSLVSEIILEGRQLGFYVLLTLQSAPATILPTALKEQFSAKIVLGNSGEQTYNTTFFLNSSSKLSKMELKKGGGWILTDEFVDPRIFYIPFLEKTFFDELRSFLND